MKLAIAALALLTASTAWAGAGDLHLQPCKATKVKQPSKCGTFTVWENRAAKTGTVDVTIDVASVKTIDPRLDTAVKGEKFFNVEKYPTMTFKSTNVVFDGDRVVGVNGDLTMLAVTKPVSLKVENFKCGENPFNKKPMCGGEASTVIKRSEWGMTANLPLAPGDDIRIVLPIEAYRDGG